MNLIKKLQILSKIFFVISILAFGIGIYERIDNQKISKEETEVETVRETKKETMKLLEMETDIESVTETESAAPVDDRLILVNKDNKVPADWVCDLVELEKGEKIDRRAYGDLMNLLTDAKKQGFHPLICSAYRSNSDQTKLYHEEIQYFIDQGCMPEEAEKKAGEWVAVPGTSEHELGLAMDIVPEEYQLLDEHQDETEFQKWMQEHCWSYGFILRYPRDKEAITGIEYESWHYRYVGREAALEMKAQNQCLEEYLKNR